MANGDTADGFKLDAKDMLGLGAAATTLITVISGLAVTGALQQMQRNHGVLLMIAFAGVLAGAAFWALAAVLKSQHKFVTWPLVILALLAFLGGVALGIVGMIETQQAQERPNVTASVSDTHVLTATATAHNLGTEGRMYTQLTGLKRINRSEFKVISLYFAASGPDASGTATQQFTYVLPTGTFAAYAISATTANDTGCFDKLPGNTIGVRHPKIIQKARTVAQHNLPGCVLIFNP